jgi:hypothetical protein
MTRFQITGNKKGKIANPDFYDILCPTEVKRYI